MSGFRSSVRKRTYGAVFGQPRRLRGGGLVGRARCTEAGLAQVVRTVTENCRALNFTTAEFEEA
ncbi:MAG: hypothetical protein IT307_01905 [Chloroflexi bacterium]|nr:hypothetical protein [Chloroflexota bacterium]